MTSEKNLKPARSSNELILTPKKGHKSDGAVMAEAAYDPAARSLTVAMDFIKGSLGANNTLNESLDALMAQVNEVRSGNLESVEKTLVVQANTLDAMFNELARRAALNMGSNLNTTETYLRLALKAQSQCRTTLETLAEVKNPPVMIARQANVTTGPQQINNGIQPSKPSRTKKITNTPNKLSGDDHELLPNTRTPTATSRNDTQMETVGKIDRTKNSRRQTRGFKEC
jgi:hypothetical protein